ncbi:lyase family protein [Rubellimicrobium aerolatum]|uniref:Lyase family protein n=1 Tax=Rubellimicrobium aerolatum TaxID=490979 RepID=A0ABW0S8L6_9RHOB|nr:lyase family protein [Rubellimicrobium aerolatum]MBP1804199.1 3-carboxy-cis,cis-muconate cycloisomerase [Rubellimicrobium aerolatum]
MLPDAGSPLYAQLLGDTATAAFLSDRAEIRAMIDVEAALAEAQGALGVIPSDAGFALARACRGLSLDPGKLAARTGVDGVPVPALVAALRDALGSPEQAEHLHWGATSQDIVDTALALRLRGLLELWDDRIGALLRALADLADRHADLPMAARTYGQSAVPTSFGAVAAAWGRPLLRHRDRLGAVRGDLLKVSLSGAAGTLSAMGGKGPEVRAALAASLGLADPGCSWHAERDGVAAFAAWMAGLLGSLGKMGEDLLLLAQSDLGEVRIAGAGGSSTMPQKQNPVGPSVLVALARTGIGLAAILQGAALHRQQRDGAAWFTEWLTFPQLCLLTGRALSLSLDLAAHLSPDPAAMAAHLEAQAGTIHAEALSFALAVRMPRPEAQVAIKDLSREALRTGTPLPDLVRQAYPDLPIPATDLGQAPGEARGFARAVRDRAGGQ